MKNILKALINRLSIVVFLILIQIFLIVFMVWKLNNYFVFFYTFSFILSVCIVIWLVSKQDNPSMKMPWIIIILLLPIFGCLFYLILGNIRLPKHFARKVQETRDTFDTNLIQDPLIMNELEEELPFLSTQSRYLLGSGAMPVYKNTTSEYLSPGEVKFERLKEELKKAEHFIFMEYFIVQEGVMWNSILDILAEKVKEGVDVRVMYDDIGCISTLPYKYDKHLESLGIKCTVFNPFQPMLSVIFNNRDHRKIAVIDGHTAFTGGINLADEYINEYEKHGHWKDASIMLKGEAVWNLTMLFLSVWNFSRKDNEDYNLFKPHQFHPEPFQSDGYYQPFGDSPLDNELLSESAYLNMINSATKYLYINTPYLVVDNELVTALSLAAKRGVDVRIVTPHIPDHWYVHIVTQSYYPQLVEAGVRIYEYTPGFIHSKTFVADDIMSIIGTINLDYRSLYHHFECGVLMYNTPSTIQIRDDFLKTLELCGEITKEECKSYPLSKRLIQGLLKIFAPLM